jgi:TP901 family phage tail tape measure protein
MGKNMELDVVVNDKGSATLSKFNRNLKGTLDDGKKGTDSLTSSMMGGLNPAMVVVAASAAAVGAALLHATKVGMEFESVMVSVGAITQATTSQFNSLEAAAMKMGAETEHSATASGEALKFLSMAGLSAADSIQALPGMLDLATAAQMDLATSSDIVTDTLSAFGMGTEELTRLSDAFIGTSTKSNTTVQMLGQSFKYVAPIAAQLGLNVEQTSAYLGVLANSGIKAGSAGTNLSQILVRTGKVAKELGIEGASLNEVLETMHERQLSATEVSRLFGMESAKSALVLMNNTEAVADLNLELYKTSGITQKTAEMMRNTLGNDLKILASTTDDVSIGMFKVFGPDLRKMVQSFTVLIKENKGAFIEMAGMAAQGFEAISVALDGAGAAIEYLRPYTIGIYETFKFAFNASGKAIALFAADMFVTVEGIGNAWNDLGDIMWSAMTFSLDGIRESWKALVSRGAEYNAALASNWNEATDDIMADWDTLVANIDAGSKKTVKIVAEDVKEIQNDYGDTIPKIPEIFEDAAKKVVDIETQKTDSIKSLLDDTQKATLDTANNIIDITQQRVNKEMTLEKKKVNDAFKLKRSGGGTFTTSWTNQDATIPTYDYSRLKWSTRPNPNYNPSGASSTSSVDSAESLFVDSISTSNDHLSTISSIQSDLLTEAKEQSAILNGAFNSVTDIIDSMTIGSLAPTQNIAAMGTKYASLLSGAKSEYPEVSADATSELTSFLPDYLSALNASSSDYLSIFKSIKGDMEVLQAALGFDIFKSGFEILSESISLSDYITFDLEDLNTAINTGKLGEARDLIADFSKQLQDDVPAAVIKAAGLEGISGFNTSLVGTLTPLSDAGDNTNLTAKNVGHDLVAMGNMFSNLASNISNEPMKDITSGIKNIRDQAVASGENLMESKLQNYVYEDNMWHIYSQTGRDIWNMMQEGRYWSSWYGEYKKTARPPAQYVPYAREGGLMTQPTIGGEAGPEWAVPTYEPENSNFLKSVGVDTGKIAAEISAGLSNSNQDIIINIDGDQLMRIIAKKGKSSPDMVKMIKEIA